MAFEKSKYKISNRGVPKDSYLTESAEWFKKALRESPEIFQVNSVDDEIMTRIRGKLGPFKDVTHRAACLWNAMTVLSMFESSGNWNEGRDTTNSTSNTPCTEEAGIYQCSGNSMNFDKSLKDCFARYSGQAWSTASSTCKKFITLTKSNHEYAIEHCARLLRFTPNHHGPVKRNEILKWLSREAVAEMDAYLRSGVGEEEVLEENPTQEILPVYPKPNKYHFRFDKQLKFPYTHIHPIDCIRSVEGKYAEIPGNKDDGFMSHIHEHAGNLGSHSEGADYHDEVPGCSSGLNWTADMCGCEKSNNALASSWDDYGNPRKGDWVEEGDIVRIRHGSQNHVTTANKRFNRKTESSFEGLGFNQSNTIKVSKYSVADIKSVQIWKPLPGTTLAPIGTLGEHPKADV